MCLDGMGEGQRCHWQPGSAQRKQTKKNFFKKRERSGSAQDTKAPIGWSEEWGVKERPSFLTGFSDVSNG